MSMGGATEAGLGRCVKIVWALIVMAISAPLISVLAPYPALPGLDAGDWFSRSGAITTVFALLAETVVVRARLSITPAGYGRVGINELRLMFIQRFNNFDAMIFVLVITGTIIWAYGDLPFKI